MGYSLELRHTGCQMLMEYWARMLANGSVPPHAKIQPRALKSILPMVFTLNMTHAGEARFGLAGTQLCTQFGQELGGKPFFATWEATSVNVAKPLLYLSHETLVPIKFELLAMSENLQFVDVEIILAPLAVDATGFMRFIGAMHIANKRPLLYSGTMLSQRLTATQLAQKGTASHARRTKLANQSRHNDGSMLVRAYNNVLKPCLRNRCASAV